MSEDETTIKTSPLTKNEAAAATGSAAPVQDPATNEKFLADLGFGCSTTAPGGNEAPKEHCEGCSEVYALDIDEAVACAEQHAVCQDGKVTLPLAVYEGLYDGAREYAFLDQEIPHEAINGHQDSYDVTAALLRNTRENLKAQRATKVLAVVVGLLVVAVVALAANALGARYRAGKAAAAVAACAEEAVADAKLELLAAGLRDVEVTGCAPVDAGGVAAWVCGATQGDRSGVVPLVGYACSSGIGRTYGGAGDPVIR